MTTSGPVAYKPFPLLGSPFACKKMDEKNAQYVHIRVN